MISDILYYAMGHREIDVTDGPGDGTRDIHSITREGKKHVTQCKFHRTMGQAVGSREANELAVALVKFGARNGLFATTGRLTAQAKREFLEDYPNYELTHLEGTRIVETVLGNPVLSAIWFDGARIASVRHTIGLPFLVRNRLRDKPLKLETASEQLDLDGLTCSLRKEWFSKALFEPYRPPVVGRLTEGWYPKVEVSVGLIKGVDVLHKIEHAQRNLVFALKEVLEHQSCRDLAVRVGIPYLTVMEGESSGTVLPLDTPAQTFIIRNGEVIHERDWLLPASSTSEWRFPDYVQTSQSNWACWYNSASDCTWTIEVLSPPDCFGLASILMRREYFRKWWRRSVFVVGKTEVCMSLLSDERRPTRVLPYGSDGTLLVWEHPRLDTGLHVVDTEIDEDGSDDVVDPFDAADRAREAEFEKWARKLRKSLAKMGLSEVSPESARHLAAAVDKDPEPNDERFVYGSVDLEYQYERVPSPISPFSRAYTFGQVWTTAATIPELGEYMKSASLNGQLEGIKWYEDEGGQLEGSFLIVQCGSVVIELASTDEIVAEYSRVALERLRTAFQLVQKHFPALRMCTACYLCNEIGLPLE